MIARNRSMALVVKGRKILLIREKLHGGEILICPGGGIESGEAPEETALRELKEETGLIGKVVQPLNIIHRHKGTLEYIFWVEVENEEALRLGCDPDLPADQQKMISVDWYDFDSLSPRDQAYMWSYGLMDVDGFGFN